MDQQGLQWRVMGDEPFIPSYSWSRRIGLQAVNPELYREPNILSSRRCVFPTRPSQSRALLSPLFPFSHLPDFEFCQTISHHRYLVYSAPYLKRYISSQERCSTPTSHQAKLTHLTSGTFVVSERILGRQQQTFLSGTTIELERLRHTHRGCLAL